MAPGPVNTILVNGRAGSAPPVCAKPLTTTATEGNGESEVAFQETHVPLGQIFVIGNNLNHSFDSRIAEF